jgi:hypothetical protein
MLHLRCGAIARDAPHPGPLPASGATVYRLAPIVAVASTGYHYPLCVCFFLRIESQECPAHPAFAISGRCAGKSRAILRRAANLAAPVASMDCSPGLGSRHRSPRPGHARTRKG